MNLKLATTEIVAGRIPLVPRYKGRFPSTSTMVEEHQRLRPPPEPPPKLARVKNGPPVATKRRSPAGYSGFLRKDPERDTGTRFHGDVLAMSAPHVGCAGIRARLHHSP